MMEKLVAMRNSKKKGFTLVELIVVLVILAILAAILIPTLTKYIDRANEKSVIAETRMCVMAAQTLASEDYATQTATPTCTEAGIKALAEITGANITVTPTVSAGKVTELVYTDTSAKLTCTYTQSTGAYVVTEYTTKNS